MRKLPQLFENNKNWVKSVQESDPTFFERLSKQQTPRYLWIGCSDSRVPANQITGLDPGEMFVHRNIANVVTNTDLNCLSVLQYAVEVLKVTDVIVCGHYGCSGVITAMGNQSFGLIDNWLRQIKDVYMFHKSELEKIADPAERANRLCELNVRAQVSNISHTAIVQNAWKRGQELNVHGWIYNLKDGLLKDLDILINSPDQLSEVFRLS